MEHENREDFFELMLRLGDLAEFAFSSPVPPFRKADGTPVTCADLAIQALVRDFLVSRGSTAPLVAEEDGEALQDVALARQVESLVDRFGGFRCLTSVEEALARDPRTDTTSVRWVLDPIDGTKGYLRGDQYATALALIEDDQVVCGVLGCPRLPAAGARGVVVWAGLRQGAFERPWSAGPAGWTELRCSQEADPSQLRTVESKESLHGAGGIVAEIRERLNTRQPPALVDSQAKYALVARGEAHAYVRWPRQTAHREKVWDHAAGFLCVQEAGGRVSDLDGDPLDFRQIEMTAGAGVLACSRPMREAILGVVADLRGNRAAT